MSQLNVACVFLIVATLFSPSIELHSGGRIPYTKTRLILEYNWPKVVKGLQRLPHVVSCEHFYVTRPDGKHDIKKCPDGLSFDYQTLLCEEKTRAKCWSKLFKTGGKRFECPFPWGLYPDVKECSRYFSCLNGKSSLRKCADSSLFDKVSRKCLNESEAICADENDIVEPGYRCPYTWGFFTYPKDCSKYYECLQKNPNLRTCKRNMLFDNFKRKCLPKSRVECGDRYNPYHLLSTQNDEISTEKTSPSGQTAVNLYSTQKDASPTEGTPSPGQIATDSHSTQNDASSTERTSSENTDFHLSQSDDSQTERTLINREEYSSGHTATDLHLTQNDESSSERTSSQGQTSTYFHSTQNGERTSSPGQTATDFHSTQNGERTSSPGQTATDFHSTQNGERTSSHRDEYSSRQTTTNLLNLKR